MGRGLLLCQRICSWLGGLGGGLESKRWGGVCMYTSVGGESEGESCDEKDRMWWGGGDKRTETTFGNVYCNNHVAIVKRREMKQSK